MNKSDLKNFDVVQLRNGEKYIFLKVGNVMLNKKHMVHIWLYNENLMYNKVKTDKDIVAVYRTTNLIPDGLATAPIIWEREEKIELTQLERLVLEHILNKGYNFIARDWGNVLCFFGLEPFKLHDEFWISDDDYYVRIPGFLGNLFQFVKWEQEEAMSIKELLNDN